MHWCHELKIAMGIADPQGKKRIREKKARRAIGSSLHTFIPIQEIAL